MDRTVGYERYIAERVEVIGKGAQGTVVALKTTAEGCEYEVLYRHGSCTVKKWLPGHAIKTVKQYVSEGAT